MKKTPQLPLTNGHHTKVRFTWRMAGIAASCSWKLKSKVYSGLAGALRMKSRCLGPRYLRPGDFLSVASMKISSIYRYLRDSQGIKNVGVPQNSYFSEENMIRNKALNCLGECPMFKQSHVRKAGTSPWKQQKMKHINLLVHLLYYEIKSDPKNNTIQ